MKPISKVLSATALTLLASGCNSFLDINTNPNAATGVTPDQLLANALTTTGAVYTNYNIYSNWAAGYWTKSNVVSGFTEEQTYGYSSTYQQGLWTGAYDNLEDYELIRTSPVVANYPNHAAIARIMKVYDFLLLVDEYGDIPYTQALKGAANTTPQFDRAEDIYKDLVVQLKGAVSDINSPAAVSGPKPGSEDVVFGASSATQMTNWKRFANSLRLRILLRMSSTSDGSRNSYVQTEMTDLYNNGIDTSRPGNDGLITADVLVQPGFAASSGQQNPFYNAYGKPVGSDNPVAQWRYVMPTNYIINTFLNNNDPRITQEYRPNTSTAAPTATNPYPQYRGGNLGEANPIPTQTVAGSATGGANLQLSVAGPNAFSGTFLRSPTQPVVLMLSAENLFSKSEAELRTLIPGGDAAARVDFTAGIQASFVTTYRNSPSPPTSYNVPSNVNGQVINPTTAFNNYVAANVGNGLIEWDTPTTRATNTYGVLTSGNRTISKQEKIITQKWLAENILASTEGWDDFRRTGLPPIPISIRAANPPATFPRRLVYPQVEINTNKANVPITTTQYDRIFWVTI